tara:strand:- start:643 stop:945 length:303 start_codon:yes stop_codon:yes gene_type:complete
VDYSFILARAISFKYCDIAVPETLKRPPKLSLLIYSLLSVRMPNPFCRGATICRNKACIDGVPMKLPTGVVADALEPNVDIVAYRDTRKRNHEVSHIRNQ